MQGNDYAVGRSQEENIKSCIADILGQGNEACMLPGQIEAQSAKLTDTHGGLLFTQAEIEGFAHITEELGEPAWNVLDFRHITI
jgi:L-2-hydroxycarboxylate dehydrogenase (NAD+)